MVSHLMIFMLSRHTTNLSIPTRVTFVHLFALAPVERFLCFKELLCICLFHLLLNIETLS
jgi:hypothetical protein